MLLANRKLIYLASPYTHPDPWVREQRFHGACDAAGKLISRNYYIYCPIAETHVMATRTDLPVIFDFWQEHNELILSRSDYLVVLKLQGWEKSVGVRGEVMFALAHEIEVFFADPNNLDGFCLGGVDENGNQYIASILAGNGTVYERESEKRV